MGLFLFLLFLFSFKRLLGHVRNINTPGFTSLLHFSIPQFPNLRVEEIAALTLDLF